MKPIYNVLNSPTFQQSIFIVSRAHNKMGTVVLFLHVISNPYLVQNIVSLIFFVYISQ